MTQNTLSVKLPASVPQSLYRAKQVRENESLAAKACGISMYQLMESAGESAFEVIKNDWPNANKILLLVGKGNNAGDAFIVGRLALQQGFKVDVAFPFSEQADALYHGDALTAYQKFINERAVKGSEKSHWLSLENLIKLEETTGLNYDLVVDGLLGTGFKGELSADFKLIIDIANKCTNNILSLDIPSGMCADSGHVQETAIVAKATVTFVAVKSGLLTASASEHCGQLHFASLNIAKAFERIVETELSCVAQHTLPKLRVRKASAHKGSSGFVMVLAANKGYPGAGQLACEGAHRSGAGLVAISCHPANQQVMTVSRPETIIAGDDYQSEHFNQLLNRANVLIIGPGLGSDEWAERAWQLACQQNKTLVVDADALHFLAQNPFINDDWILTPHPGEAARLLKCSVAQIQRDRFASVRAIQKKYGGICLLKGPGTLVTNGEKISVNCSGNEGMASGGMGDVLSGVIASLVGQSENLFDATQTAAFVHGKAADLAIESGTKGLLASDLFPYIRKVVNQL